MYMDNTTDGWRPTFVVSSHYSYKTHCILLLPRLLTLFFGIMISCLQFLCLGHFTTCKSLLGVEEWWTCKIQALGHIDTPTHAQTLLMLKVCNQVSNLSAKFPIKKSLHNYSLFFFHDNNMQNNTFHGRKWLVFGHQFRSLKIFLFMVQNVEKRGCQI